MDKKRRLADNLPPEKAAAPVEVGAVWTDAGLRHRQKNTACQSRIHSGHFFVDGNGQIVARAHRRKAALQKQCSKRRLATFDTAANPPRSSAASWQRVALPAPRKEPLAAMPLRRFLSFRDFDWALLGLVLLLCALSVLEVHSATVHTKFASFETKQIFFIAAGLVGMFILAKIDYHRLIDLVALGSTAFLLSRWSP